MAEMLCSKRNTNLRSVCVRVCPSYILVYDALYLHRLHDVGDELRVSVGVSDLLMQQSSDAALHTRTNTYLHTFRFLCHYEKKKKQNTTNP